MLICPEITTFLSLKENYADIISDISLKVQFPRKSYVKFLVGIEREFPHLSRKALNVLFRFARDWLLSSGSHQMNLKNDLRAAISKLQPRYCKLRSTRQPQPSY
jgi:hypothetical protein